jgi:hypothetical protein
MNVKELAVELDKMNAVSMGWAIGDSTRATKFWNGHTVEMNQVEPLVKGKVPDAVSTLNEMGDALATWYVLEDGRIVGLHKDLYDNFGYIFPQDAVLPKVRGYRAPVVPR